MLGREDLGWRHERCLIAIFHRDEHCLERDDGLTGPDVALEKTAHGAGLAHVCHDLAERSLLRSGGVKGQDLANGLAHFVVGGEADAGTLSHAAPLEFEAEFEKEQLFKDEPPVGRGGGTLKLRQRSAFGWIMDLAQRCFASWKVETGEHGCGQALRNCSAHRLKQIEDHLALPSRGQLASAEGLVYRRDATDFEQPRLRVVAGIGKQFKLGLNHFEVAGGARRLDLAVDGYCLPGMELALKIAAMEPDALERVAPLADGEFEDGHLSRAQQNGAADLCDDAGHFAGLQFIETARILAVLIAKGEVVEQVFGGLDAFCGEDLRYARTDAAHVHDWSVKAGHTPDANAFLWTAYQRAGTSDLA